MPDSANDTQPLSHFKRKTADFLARLKASGQPVVLTVRGQAEVVVQDAAAYQRLTELAEKAEMMEFLRTSKAEVDAGRTVPALEALDALAQKHKLKAAD